MQTALPTGRLRPLARMRIFTILLMLAIASVAGVLYWSYSPNANMALVETRLQQVATAEQLATATQKALQEKDYPLAQSLVALAKAQGISLSSSLASQATSFTNNTWSLLTDFGKGFVENPTQPAKTASGLVGRMVAAGFNLTAGAPGKEISLGDASKQLQRWFDSPLSQTDDALLMGLLLARYKDLNINLNQVVNVFSQSGTQALLAWYIPEIRRVVPLDELKALYVNSDRNMSVVMDRVTRNLVFYGDHLTKDTLNLTLFAFKGGATTFVRYLPNLSGRNQLDHAAKTAAIHGNRTLAVISLVGTPLVFGELLVQGQLYLQILLAVLAVAVALLLLGGAGFRRAQLKAVPQEEPAGLSLSQG